MNLKTLPGSVTNRRIIATHSALFGKPLADLTAFAQHQVVVMRITRNGLGFSPKPGFRLQFGDVLMVVGEAPQIDEVAIMVGNSSKALGTPQPLTFFLGIALGVLAVAILLFLPGLPAAVKLGLAGGPLVVAILLSRLTTTGPLIWHIPHTANHMIREIGISLFLVVVGSKIGR